MSQALTIICPRSK